MEAMGGGEAGSGPSGMMSKPKMIRPNRFNLLGWAMAHEFGLAEMASQEQLDPSLDRIYSLVMDQLGGGLDEGFSYLFQVCSVHAITCQDVRNILDPLMCTGPAGGSGAPVKRNAA